MHTTILHLLSDAQQFREHPLSIYRQIIHHQKTGVMQMHQSNICTRMSKMRKLYVGQTKRRLMGRMMEHLCNIRQRCPSHIVSRHYTRDDHDGISNLDLDNSQTLSSIEKPKVICHRHAMMKLPASPMRCLKLDRSCYLYLTNIINMTIHILEFISAHPDSTVAAAIRNKCERKWIFHLRTVVPLVLDIWDL